MIAVVQRVSQGRVTVGEEVVGQIACGLVVLVSVHTDDTQFDTDWTAQKLATLRIFPNNEKAFDLDVQQIGGKILLVSNFTVAADTRSGRRPSLSPAAPPEVGIRGFQELVKAVQRQGIGVETGRFGADMRVEIVNDGPATFLLDSRETRPK